MLRSPIRRALLLSALATPVLAWDARAASASWTEYLAARAAFKAEVEGYWTSIAEGLARLFAGGVLAQPANAIASDSDTNVVMRFISRLPSPEEHWARLRDRRAATSPA